MTPRDIEERRGRCSASGFAVARGTCRCSPALRPTELGKISARFPQGFGEVSRGWRRRSNPPQFRKGSFYRLSREDAAIDVFVADHLPRTRRATFGGGKWRLVETPGGAQAISRSVSIDLKSQNHFARIRIPSILGAIIMKSAVVSPTDPLSEKHLNDIALLASLMEKPVDQRLLLHGSDLQRIKRAARILENPNHPAWLTLPDARRQCGYMNLRILSSPEFHN